MTTQDSQSELDYILHLVDCGGIHAKGKEGNGYPTYFTEPYYLLVEKRKAIIKQAIEAYVTTGVKEAERLARIDEHVKLSNARSLNMDIDEWSLHRKEELKAQLNRSKGEYQ